MDIYGNGSMDDKGLLLLQCQLLHHIGTCERCQRNGLLPDFLCREGTELLNAVTVWADVKENYECDCAPNRDKWKDAEQRQTEDPLLSFWPGTN